MKLNYKIISKSSEIEKYYSKAKKYCYFCDNPSATFKTKPHLISQLLGANNITYNHECDSCNKFFSETYENDLQKFVSPFIITSQTKSGNSNKYPKYKPHSKSDFSIQFTDQLSFKNYDPIHNLLKVNHENKTGSIEIPRNKFIPINVYKAFLKIAIGLMPEETVNNYQQTIEWLKDKNATKPFFPDLLACSFSFRLINKKVSAPYADLHEAKEIIIGNKEYIHHILVIRFANIVMQFFMPPSLLNIRNHHQENELVLEIAPMAIHHVSIFQSKTINYNRYDLFKSEAITMEEIFPITFQSIEVT